MLDDLKIDELLEKVDSRYGLALATARRARQISEYTATLGLNESLGIPGPQVHTRSQHPLTIAIEELREGKLEISLKEPGNIEDEVGGAEGDDFLSAGPGPTAAEEVGAEEAEAIEDDDAEDASGEDEGAA